MTKYKQKKYKDLLKLRDLFRESKRIFNFKRPKWSLLKKICGRKFPNRLKRNQISKLPYYHQSGFLIPTRWTNLRTNFRESIIAKRRLFYFYLIKTRLFVLKQRWLKEKSLDIFLSRMESRLDIILWRSGCVSTPAVARFYIIHKNVFVNNNLITRSQEILKEGDIIHFSENMKKFIFNSCAFKLEKIIEIRRKIIKQKAGFDFMTPFFLEINWNIMQIALISTLKKEHLGQLSYLFNTNLNLPSIRNYFRRI